MKKYKKQICRVLLIFFAAYFLMDTVQNYQNKNYLILSTYQSIQNIVTILPSIEDEIEANQTVADSFDLPTLELISMDFRNSMDELCTQPTFLTTKYQTSCVPFIMISKTVFFIKILIRRVLTAKSLLNFIIH